MSRAATPPRTLAGLVSGALLLGVFAPGCAGQLKPEDLAAGASTALASLPKAAASLADTIKPPVGTPTAIYTRVARGILTCWMGAYGPLKGTHLFQADADADHKGGKSEIRIHERIAGSPNQPGRVAYTVLIEPVGETATVAATNVHLPGPDADKLSADVARWASGEETCLREAVAVGWDAEAKTGPQAPPAQGTPNVTRTGR
ncbi:MAG: hypothetical protein NW205_09640 [Hyphomicrobiaceae bacterium]|nr:hypothetical protein [Hyphomicrobiaceae bacterium]